MKVWVYKAVSILLSTLVIGASADVAFAQKQLKYVPKAAKGAKVTPYVVNPKLPPAVRANFAMPVVRPNVSAQMDRLVTQKAAQTPRKMPSKRAPKKTPQQIIDAFKKWVAKHPGTSPRQKIRGGGKFLSLTELRKRTEQGDIQAAELADELELGQAIGIALQNWPKTWPKEYQELKALYDENRNKKTPQQVISAYKQWVAKHPGTSPRRNIGNLSLTELRKRAEQGNTQAAELADELELGQAINNAQRTWPEDSPEYRELAALYNQNRNTKTPQQVIAAYKQWIAKHPATSPRQSIEQNGNKLSLAELRKRAEQGNAQAAELADEVELGQAIYRARQTWPEDSPEYQELDALYNQNRNTKTPQQVISAYKQWIAQHPATSPRQAMEQNGNKLSLAELRKRAEHGDTQAAELADELELGQAISNALKNWANPFPKEYQELKALYDGNRNTKTPQQILAGYSQWTINHPGTSPRQSIRKNGRDITLTELRKRAEQGDAQSAELADELELGQAIGMALQSWSKDLPMYQKLKALYEENRNRSANKPTEELYKDLVAHIKDYGHYPLWNERTLYTNLYNRLRRYQSTMADGKYADPWLQKIYELKTLIQNAPDGKFTLTPDGQGGYTLEIEEPVTEELDVSAPQKVEELAPAVPSVHALHEHITEDIKNMILAVRDQAALERRDFYPWLRDMQQNHLDQIVNKDTSDALWALNRAISFDYKTGQNRRAVTYLLQTVNNYVGVLGLNEQLGYFNKIMYRGKLEPGMLPQADLFHVVAEQEGMSFDGTLAPQVEQLNKLAWQAYKQGQPLSVNFADDDNQEKLTALEIEKGVHIQTVKQDFQTAIQTLLPPGFEVRMGLHELGISGSDMTKFRKGHLHIHLERPATTEEMQDGFLTDVSISFKIQGLDRFVRKYNKNTRTVEPLTDKEIAQNYLTLFGSFLDQAAKDKLSDLAR